MDNKTINLIEFCQGMLRGENGRELYDKYLDDVKSVTPQDIFLVMNEQLKRGNTAAELLTIVEKLMNIFHESLEKYQWSKPKEGTFLYYLMEENKVLVSKLEAYKTVIKSDETAMIKSKGLVLADDLEKYNEHLLKLENILFPYLEKKNERYYGLKIMWELHDVTRKDLKNAKSVLNDSDIDEHILNKAIGILYFRYYGLVQKQELIMFPAATSILDENEFMAMHVQSFDFEFPFIERPQKPDIKLRDLAPDVDSKTVLKTDTGNLTFEQIELLINTLPVDVTFINEYDKVEFFSKPKDRIFPRTVAVIGRDVRNCHPPKSVHVVEEILDSFRKGEKDSATFWIQLNGMFILIQYFALRNENGEYKGCLEVSQDITEIKKLEGQQRLLDWGNKQNS